MQESFKTYLLENQFQSSGSKGSFIFSLSYFSLYLSVSLFLSPSRLLSPSLSPSRLLSPSLSLSLSPSRLLLTSLSLSRLLLLSLSLSGLLSMSLSVCLLCSVSLSWFPHLSSLSSWNLSFLCPLGCSADDSAPLWWYFSYAASSFSSFTLAAGGCGADEEEHADRPSLAFSFSALFFSFFSFFFFFTFLSEVESFAYFASSAGLDEQVCMMSPQLLYRTLGKYPHKRHCYDLL